MVIEINIIKSVRMAKKLAGVLFFGVQFVILEPLQKVPWVYTWKWSFEIYIIHINFIYSITYFIYKYKSIQIL